MSKKSLLSEYIWTDYYDFFDYFSEDTVRPGCSPRCLIHQDGSRHAIILIHGLSDSPYFVSAIGDFFHFELKYNVYMPLLHFHGLLEPKGMEGIQLEEWRNNITYSIEYAQKDSEIVSIGGLSTGGTLSVATALSGEKITGALYLFSAALDLAGGLGGTLGELKERLLRTFLADLLDRNKPLIGDNPYRYSHVDLDGAQELAKLIKQTDELIKKFSIHNPLKLPIFAAHSEADTTASISGIEKLERICSAKTFTFMRFAKELGIPHASVVLEEAISGIEKPEPANQKFSEMTQKIKDFAKKL
ncbi:MAG: hypothetical protein QNK27_07475 [Desulfuromusa sp.]|nr:hypothetical protein [Desulfuromusa sp.]